MADVNKATRDALAEQARRKELVEAQRAKSRAATEAARNQRKGS